MPCLEYDGIMTPVPDVVNEICIAKWLFENMVLVLSVMMMVL